MCYIKFGLSKSLDLIHTASTRHLHIAATVHCLSVSLTLFVLYVRLSPSLFMHIMLSWCSLCACNQLQCHCMALLVECTSNCPYGTVSSPQSRRHSLQHRIKVQDVVIYRHPWLWQTLPHSILLCTDTYTRIPTASKVVGQGGYGGWMTAMHLHHYRWLFELMQMRQRVARASVL